MSGCLGSVLAALVDGELDHAAREKAHRHLAHCGVCRAEVEAQRRLKASLSRLRSAEPSSALLARLRAVPAPGTPPADAFAAPVASPVPAPVPAPVTAQPAPGALGPSAVAVRSRTGPRAPRPLPAGPPHSAAGLAAPTRPAAGRPAPRPVSARRTPAVLPRRAVAGSAFAVLGVAAALTLAPPPQRAVSPPPGTVPAVLVTDVATPGRAPAVGLLGGDLTSVSRVGSPVSGVGTAVGSVRRPAVPVRVATSAAVGRSTR